VANDLEKAWKYVVANGPTDLNGRLIDTAKVLQGINPYSGKTLPNINYWCAGHANPDFLASILPASGTFDVVSQNLFSWTGAIYDGKSGAATIMDAIAFGWQSQEILINGSVSTATGVIQATANPLEDVINADTDKVNVTRDSYDGNHYRTVQVAVVAADSAYLKPASGATTTVTGLEQFLLLRVGDYGGPGSNWCVAYYGAADSTSEGPIDRPSGIWILRLVS
jgi:hypothetical protein